MSVIFRLLLNRVQLQIKSKRFTASEERFIYSFWRKSVLLNPQKLKPCYSRTLHVRRATQLLRFSFSSCCCLIKHFKKHPAREDVFPCTCPSLHTRSLHVSLTPLRQTCIWCTSGPSFMSIQDTEVVVWWEKQGGETGRPVCLLCDWHVVDREIWEWLSNSAELHRVG